MGNFLIIQHMYQSKMLLREWEYGVYEYYHHGMWSRYSTEPIKLPESTLIHSKFEAENNAEAVIIYDLLE